MGNMSQGLQTGMQGAQFGGQVGGVYGAVIGGVAGFALGYETPDYEKMARDKYNAEVIKHTVSSLFDMRRQQNVENMRTSQALAAYQDENAVAKSQYNAAFGAADIIGSSADALQNTIDFQTTQAQAQTWFNFEVGIDNYNTQVASVVNRGISGLRRTKGATNTMDFGALTSQGLQMYEQYGGQISSAFRNMGKGGYSGLEGFGDFGGGMGSGGSGGNGGMMGGFTGGGMSAMSA